MPVASTPKSVASTPKSVANTSNSNIETDFKNKLKNNIKKAKDVDVKNNIIGAKECVKNNFYFMLFFITIIVFFFIFIILCFNFSYHLLDKYYTNNRLCNVL